MNTILRIPKSPTNQNSILDILLTGTMLASLSGILASVFIFAALIVGRNLGQKDIAALIAIIVVLTAACTFAWIGIRIANREARQQTTTLAVILNSISDGVLVLDAQGEFISANPALLKMIPEEKLRELNAQPLEETIEWKRTVFSVNAAPVPGVGSVVIFRDETRRHETELAKEALLATASHELRTPLGVVMNYLELLLMLTQMGKVNTTLFAGHLNRALENSQRLLRLINDILDQAQLQAGMSQLKQQSFNLPALFEKTYQFLAVLLTEKNLVYAINIAPNVPSQMTGDPDRLQKVLVNLIGNAIKFTERGGIQVIVSAPSPDTLSIIVIDSGRGIPPEQLPDIFEPFRRASNYALRGHQGAGLGLSIAKQIIIAMGGQITVSSTLGQGSTFTVLLPLSEAPP